LGVKLFLCAAVCGVVACQADTFTSQDAGGDSAPGVDASNPEGGGPDGSGVDAAPDCTSPWCSVGGLGTDLLSVLAPTDKQVFVGGKNGFVALWDGTIWVQLPISTSGDVIDLAGSGGTLYAATSSGEIWEHTSQWSLVRPLPNVVGIVLDEAGHLWASVLGSSSSAVFGDVLSDVTAPVLSTGMTIVAMAVTANLVVVAGHGTGANVIVSDHAGNAAGSVVGGDPSIELRGAAANDAVLAVAGAGGIVGYALVNNAWTSTIETSADWNGVAVRGANDFVVVGSNGASGSAKVSPFSFSSQPTGTTKTLRAVSTTIGGHYWAVGDSGTVLRATF
jgi:hypothetical protein